MKPEAPEAPEEEHSAACFQWHLGCAVARVIALEYQVGWALGSMSGARQRLLDRLDTWGKFAELDAADIKDLADKLTEGMKLAHD